MLLGKQPEQLEERAVDAALILHADHEFNASTFAARVTAATLADMYAAIASAIGTLSGPLHGGANTAVMEMLLEIADKQEPRRLSRKRWRTSERSWASATASTRPRIRARRTCAGCREELGKKHGAPQWFEMSRRIEDAMKAREELYANVDFYSASTYLRHGHLRPISIRRSSR